VLPTETSASYGGSRAPRLPRGSKGASFRGQFGHVISLFLIGRIRHDPEIGHASATLDGCVPMQSERCRRRRSHEMFVRPARIGGICRRRSAATRAGSAAAVVHRAMKPPRSARESQIARMARAAGQHHRVEPFVTSSTDTDADMRAVGNTTPRLTSAAPLGDVALLH